MLSVDNNNGRKIIVRILLYIVLIHNLYLPMSHELLYKFKTNIRNYIYIAP